MKKWISPFVFFITLFSLIFALFPKNLPAQTNFGVNWHIPEDTREARKQLRAFHSWGFEYLSVDTKMDPQLLDMADSLGFCINVRIPNYFTTAYDLRTEGEEIVQNAVNFVEYYQRYPNICGIGLFHLAADYHPTFRRLSGPLVQKFNEISEWPVYLTFYLPKHQEVDELPVVEGIMYRASEMATVDITADDRLQGILLKPEIERYNLRGLQQMIHSEPFAEGIPLYIDSKWLLYQVNHHPELANFIREFANDSEALFSTPNPKVTRDTANWIVLLLVLLWGSFAFHYGIVPLYRKSFSRYFVTHHFFVNDVMERRIRTISTGVIILIQQALLGGTFFYLLSAGLLSQTGLEALHHHYPLLGIMGNNRFIFFLGGVLFMLLTQVIYLLWLYLLHADVNYFNQVVLLYAWPQQLQFFIITIMATLFLAGSTGFLFKLMMILIIFIWLASFYIAAADLTKMLRDRKVRYLIYTAGLHTILLTLLLVYIFSWSSLPNVLSLAMHLS